MIPDEAVEAAAKVILHGHDEGHHAWKIAYAALEAAAPHLMAQAWDEGMEAMYATTSSEWPPIPEANPYRSAGADRG